MNLDVGLMAVLITILLAIVGFAFGYGVLTNRVNSHTRAIDKLESNHKLIDTKLDIIITKMAVVEIVVKNLK